VSLSGTGNVNFTTNNASVYLNSLTDLRIATMSTGSGNIVITSDGAIDDIANDNVVYVTSTGTINLTSNGAIGANIFNLNTGAVTINSTGGNNVSLVANAAALLIDSIDTGGAGDILIHTSFGINDLDDVGDNIVTTGTLSLTSDAGAIGSSGGAQGLNVNVGDITVTGTGGNDVKLTENGAMTINSIVTGGNGTVSLVSNSTIDDIDDVGDNIQTNYGIFLTSSGAI